MPFSCKDCSYRGVQRGHAGECPACGSHNIVPRPWVMEQKGAPKKWRVIVLVVLWTYLIGTIIWKLTH